MNLSLFGAREWATFSKQRSEPMMSWSGPSFRVATCWRGGGLPALALLVVGCVAQEPYDPSPHTGGAAPVASSGAGGLSLATSGAAGAPAGGEAAVEPTSVRCHSSDECAPPLPYCSASLGRCVECLSRRNCTGTERPYCDLSSNSCVYCLSDAQCLAVAPYCATSIGHCVQCLSAENCGSAGLLCDRDNYRCVPSCQSHADCDSAPSTPFCDPARNLCVACVDDAGCSGATPRCDLSNDSCVGCVGDDDCRSPSPRCDLLQHSCVECLSSRDCQPGVSCVAGACANPR